MVVDASAMASVFFMESDAPRFLRALQQTPYACMSVANFLEIAIIIDNRDAPEQMVDTDLFLAEGGSRSSRSQRVRRGSPEMLTAAFAGATIRAA